MSDISLIDRMFRKFNHVTLWGFLGRGLNAAETADEEPSEMRLALQTLTAVGGNNDREVPVFFQQSEGGIHQLAITQRDGMPCLRALGIRTDE